MTKRGVLVATILLAVVGALAFSQHYLSSSLSVPFAVAQQTECLTDVDGNGVVEVNTDIVYIARHLLGLDPVPASFRADDPTIPPDEDIAARIDAAGDAYDVDMNGTVNVATDIVYIARHLLGLDPVPPSFRDDDPTIPSDDDITAKIDALCQETEPPPFTLTAAPDTADVIQGQSTSH